MVIEIKLKELAVYMGLYIDKLSIKYRNSVEVKMKNNVLLININGGEIMRYRFLRFPEGKYKADHLL